MFFMLTSRQKKRKRAETNAFCIWSKTSLFDDYFNASFSSVTAKEFSGSARTSANISSSHSVHRLEFFGSCFFFDAMLKNSQYFYKLHCN